MFPKTGYNAEVGRVSVGFSTAEPQRLATAETHTCGLLDQT